jgi:hypothetical protein
MPFDERSGVKAYDRSGKGNHGTIHGATWVAGRRGAALSFDGVDDYVETQKNMVQLTKTTFSAWLNPSTQLKVYTSVVELVDGVTIRATLFWNHPTANKWQFRIRGATTEGASPAQTVPTGSWHHLVGSYDGTTIRLYYDGVEVGNGTSFTGGIGTYTHPVEIGRAFNQVTYVYTGLIGDVRIYNRVLTAAEVKRLYESERLNPR